MWIVLAIVGGVIVLCGCCVGVPAIFYLTNKEKFDTAIGAQIQVEQFMQNVSVGNTDAAYEQLSKAYQSRMNKQQFKSFLDKNAGLRSQRGHQMTMDQTSIKADSVSYTGSVTTGSGSTLVCTMKMVKEGGQWKVDDFTVK